MRVAAYAYTNPIVVVFGWLILHEPITSRTIVASIIIIIISAVLLITTEETRTAKPKMAQGGQAGRCRADEVSPAASESRLA